MIAFRRWIRIRKRWVRGKRLLGSFGALLLMAGALHLQPAVAAAAPERNREWVETLQLEESPRTVKHVRSFICGVEETFLGKLDAGEVLRLLDEHPQWQPQLTETGEIAMIEQVEDLSETCKQRAYFSLDKLGQLSLFEGPPEQERVIRTFFQLDTDYMESSLPRAYWEALTKGIRISDVDEYNSVLSTFSEYALQPVSAERTPH